MAEITDDQIDARIQDLTKQGTVQLTEELTRFLRIIFRANPALMDDASGEVEIVNGRIGSDGSYLIQ